MKSVVRKIRYQDIPKDYNGAVLLFVTDECEKMPYDEAMADIKLKRNPGNHKRFFAFRNASFEMQDVYDDKEVWRRHLLLNAGHVEEHISPKTGDVGFVIKSINWDELDELEFKPIFNSVVNAFIKWYGHDLDEMQINTILEF